MTSVVLILVVVDNGIVLSLLGLEKMLKQVLILVVVDNGIVRNINTTEMTNYARS